MLHPNQIAGALVHERIFQRALILDTAVNTNELFGTWTCLGMGSHWVASESRVLCVWRRYKTEEALSSDHIKKWYPAH